MNVFKIVALPGDGVGPEVLEQAARVLQLIAEQEKVTFELQYEPIGGRAIDEEGTPLPEKTVQAAKQADAILFGAVGGPKWDENPSHLRPEAGLLAIRKALGLYANLRPARMYPCMAQASTLKEEVVAGVDLMVVRELTGGIYFGNKQRFTTEEGRVAAQDTLLYHEDEIERIVRKGFEIAGLRRKKLVSVDKANVLESSRLWRSVVDQVAQDYPDIQYSHMYVDNCAMQLVRAPKELDVIVTENMFGDILSDEASMLTGSIGMLASASLSEGNLGLYEPVHGSAPDIAGQGIVNPIAMILSAALMLRYSLGMEQAARRIEAAIEKVLEDGIRTRDIAVNQEAAVSTEQMTAYILAAMKQ
jgi:3-isopropylmalate dehydrogenase